MTVAELIEKLKGLPQDAEVMTTVCGDGGPYSMPATHVELDTKVQGNRILEVVSLVW